MDSPRQMLRRFELSFHERTVDDEFCLSVLNLVLLPRLDLALHRFEVPLHAIDTDRNRIHETESFGVLRKYGSEIAVECHIVADEDSVAYRHRKTHRFVV